MAERAHPEDPGFKEGSLYRANLFKRYAFANKFTKGKTVLDIPCGVGWGTSLLKGKYRIRIDIAADAVAYGKKHYPGIDFLVGDMANIPLKDNSIDTVVCLEGFEHVSKNTGMQFLAEAVRVIKENGLLVMTVPVILPGGKHSGNPYHLHESALSDLKNIVAHKFYTQSLEIVKGPDGPVVYFVGSPKEKMNVPKFSHEESSIMYPKKSKYNILLTTSAAPTQSPFSTGEKRPPIGIGFLISVLRNAGHKVFFIDNYLQPSNFLETDYLQKYKIDYVGIYANTICFRDTLRMVHKLEHLRKMRRWNGKIIIGGPHTTVAWQTIPDFVDYIVQGEGEQAIVDIVNGNVTQRIVSYPRIENLDVLPMPAWDYFAKLPYNWSMPWFEHGPVFTMNTSRGCPFNCTFCSVQSIWGRKYTYFSAERIVADIQCLIETYGVKGIYFREDNFTLNRERLKRFCVLLIEKNLNIQWACESRVSTLDRELVELMVRAGLCGFYFGVESGSQRILDMLHKDTTVQQIKDAFKLCNEFNVKAAASVIVGVPDEKESDLRQTNDLLRQINPTVVWPNVFVGIPDSKLYRFALNNRLYEYIDDRGLVYLQGHNSKVKHYYGVDSNAYIPVDESKKDMTTKPKISILMSVYNGEQFIKKALKSIYNQTYQDFEVIIVDDASTDKTSDILINMKDSRTFIYRNFENKGLTKSLNIGLKLCRGEYIARMDADDISRPQRFEKQVRFLDENPNCVALGCWCDRIDANGEIYGAYDRRPTRGEDIKKTLLVANCIAHGTAMLRRSSLVKIGGYNEKYKYSQDHDLWLRLSEAGEIRNIEEYLYELRFWAGNITAQKQRQQYKYSQLAVQEALHRRNSTKPMVQVSQTDCGKLVSGWKPKFSVVMPNYNNAKYITEAIGSVLNQSFRDWELIIVDDCSTDNSLDIITQYLNDKRIKLIQLKSNCGYAASMKTGITNVRSDYFGILHSDDCLLPQAIETMYEHHIKFPDCGLIYSQFAYCDENLNQKCIGFCREIPQGRSSLDVRVSHFITFKLCDYLKTTGYDENILYAEDIDIIYKMEEVTRLKFVDKCVYLYRELPNSISHSKSKINVRIMSGVKARINTLKRRCTALAASRRQAFEQMLRQVVKAARANYTEVEQYFIILGKLYENGVFDDIELPPHIESRDIDDKLLWIAANVTIKSDKLCELHANQRNKEGQPLVSIYMVTYNEQEFIAQAIESVLAQTYKNFELLIVNDGSNDATSQIIASYSDERICYIYKKHKNFASGMNRAIIEAKGEYIIGVDSDDFIDPDYIEKLVACAEKHPEVDYFYPAKFVLVDESGNLTGVEWNYLDFSDNQILPAFLLDQGYGPIPNAGSLKRRSLFTNKCELYKELGTVEDFTFLCRNALRINFKRVQDHSTYFYRRMASGNSQKFKARNQLMARALNDMVLIYPPQVLYPQIRYISPDLREKEYYKYLMTTFYKHSQSNMVRYGEYFRQYGDYYKAKLLSLEEGNEVVDSAGALSDQKYYVELFEQGAEHLKVGRPADALVCFDGAYRLEDKASDLQYARAVALAQLGRMDDARLACEAELAIQPNHKGAQMILNKISGSVNVIN